MLASGPCHAALVERLTRAVVELATAVQFVLVGAVAAGLDRVPPSDVSDDPGGLAPDEARGAELADPRTLRGEVERALAECVAAVVDGRVSLVGSRRGSRAPRPVDVLRSPSS